MHLRVVGNIVSLALRRYLTDNVIPHQAAPALSFPEADRFDIEIGGRRCVLVAQLVCYGDELNKVSLLEDRGREVYRDVDLYLFIRLDGQVNRSRGEIDESQQAGEPVYLIHQMPDHWAAPERWSGLDRLAFKTDTLESISIDLHWQDKERNHLVYQAELQPRRREKVRTGLYSLGSVHATSIPSGPVGIHSPKLEELHLIHPYQWGNIWVYGRSMTMLGYITRAAFHQKSERVTAEADLPSHCMSELELLSLPVTELIPVEDLFNRARAWADGF